MPFSCPTVREIPTETEFHFLSQVSLEIMLYYYDFLEFQGLFCFCVIFYNVLMDVVFVLDLLLVDLS